MAFTLPSLPFDLDALVPFISKETLEFHHGKHHKTYVDKLNGFAAEDAVLASMSLEDIIKSKSGGIFNNAAQIYNHNFYWSCIAPKKSDKNTPSGAIAYAIEKKFGSFDAFITSFTNECLSHFGSGWVWLVMDPSGELLIKQTHDAAVPIQDNHIPLLVCDVWEHAYYIDYRNNRANYVAGWFNIINWTFVNQQFQDAQKTIKFKIEDVEEVRAKSGFFCC